MNDLLGEWFAFFAAETGILGEVRQYQELGAFLLALLAVLLCFWGIKSYRLGVAVWVYAAVILCSSILFRDRMNWGAAVTFFSIIGFAAAFLAYQWNKMGAVIMAGTIIGIFAHFLGFPFAAVIVCILSGGMAAWYFPEWGICFTTSLFGGFLLSELLPVTGAAFGASAVVLTVSGFLIQTCMSEKLCLWKRKRAEKI